MGVALLAWAAVYEGDSEYYIVLPAAEVSGGYLTGVLTSLGAAVLLIPVLELTASRLRRQVADDLAHRDPALCEEELQRAIRTIGSRYLDAGWRQATSIDHADRDSICFIKGDRHIGMSWHNAALAVSSGCAAADTNPKQVATLSNPKADATAADLKGIRRFVREALAEGDL
jgi:hypothetical protein